MATFSVLIMTCSCLILSLTSQSKGWRGIVPLVSTRADIERLLGPCSQRNGPTCLYETDSEMIVVIYSDGPCEKGWPFGYNVPNNAVVRLEVSPARYVNVADLDLNLDTYEKRVNGDGSVMYISDREGIAVQVFDGKVGSIVYGSTTEQAALRCAGLAPGGLPKETEVADAHSRFYSYGEVQVAEEMVYLDAFAKLLRQEPNAQGYIITYAGQRSLVNEGRRRLQCQRNYLIKRQGIDRERITTIDGGYRPNRMVELYVLLRGGPVPVPFPSVRPSRVEVVKENRRTTKVLSLCSDSLLD